MKLFLFTNEVSLARQAEQAGIDSIVIDWENKGKEQRQKGYTLETNKDTVKDLARIAKSVNIPITVRINAISKDSDKEVETALENGARIIMLPMARELDEIDRFMDIVNDRAETLVQIETPQLVENAGKLNKRKWDFTYIGLNDLMVERKGRFIWEALLDGTVESVCRRLKGRAYGFGGITVLGGGEPINVELLIHEYTRLKCSLAFLRRAFKKEILDRDIVEEIKSIHSFIATSKKRGPAAVDYDRLKLNRVLKRLVSGEGNNNV